MSDYEYDTGATRLVISEGLNIRDDKKLAIVSAEHLEGANIAVAVQAEDAPAVALAILEAAGYDDFARGGGAYAARDLLWAVVNTQKLKAEREAEDAKVRGWLCAVWPTAYADDFDVESWHRSLYRASSKYHEEA